MVGKSPGVCPMSAACSTSQYGDALLKILFTICVQIVSIPMILPVKNAMICLNEFQSDKQSFGKQ